MIRAGVPLLWVNPIDETVGTVWAQATAHACDERWCTWRGLGETEEPTFEIPLQADLENLTVLFAVDQLAACGVGPEGFGTPTTQRLAANEAAYAQARNADRAGVEARRQNWVESPVYAFLMAEHGSIPDIFAPKSPMDNGVFGFPEHWHATLYAEHIRGRRRGHRFTLNDSAKTLSAHGFALHKHQGQWAAAITGLMHHLSANGLVDVRLDWRTQRVTSFTVLADLHSRITTSARPVAMHAGDRAT